MQHASAVTQSAAMRSAVGRAVASGGPRPWGKLSFTALALAFVALLCCVHAVSDSVPDDVGPDVVADPLPPPVVPVKDLLSTPVVPVEDGTSESSSPLDLKKQEAERSEDICLTDPGLDKYIAPPPAVSTNRDPAWELVLKAIKGDTINHGTSLLYIAIWWEKKQEKRTLREMWRDLFGKKDDLILDTDITDCSSKSICFEMQSNVKHDKEEDVFNSHDADTGVPGATSPQRRRQMTEIDEAATRGVESEFDMTRAFVQLIAGSVKADFNIEFVHVKEKGSLHLCEDLKEMPLRELPKLQTLFLVKDPKKVSEMRSKGLDVAWISTALNAEILGHALLAYRYLYSEPHGKMDHPKRKFVDWSKAREWTRNLPAAYYPEMESTVRHCTKHGRHFHRMTAGERYNEVTTAWRRILELTLVFKRHFTWDQFQFALDDIAKTHGTENVLYVGEAGESKSNCWVAKHLAEILNQKDADKNTHLRDRHHVIYKAARYDLWKYMVRNPHIRDIVVLDDVSLSGNQMGDIVSTVTEFLSKANQEHETPIHYRIHARPIIGTTDAISNIGQKYNDEATRQKKKSFTSVLGVNYTPTLTVEVHYTLLTAQKLFSEEHLCMLRGDVEHGTGPQKILQVFAEQNVFMTSDWKIVDGVSMSYPFTIGMVGSSYRDQVYSHARSDFHLEFSDAKQVGTAMRTVKVGKPVVRTSYFSQDGLWRQQRFLPCLCPPYKPKHKCIVPDGLGFDDPVTSQLVGCPNFDPRVVGGPLKSLGLPSNDCEEITAKYYHSERPLRIKSLKIQDLCNNKIVTKGKCEIVEITLQPGALAQTDRFRMLKFFTSRRSIQKTPVCMQKGGVDASEDSLSSGKGGGW